MTSKCSYCTSILCQGCSDKYSGKFFKGYKPHDYFKLDSNIHNYTDGNQSIFTKMAKYTGLVPK